MATKKKTTTKKKAPAKKAAAKKQNPAHVKPVKELTGHTVNPCNDQLEILVMDEASAGGAHHHYRVKGFTATPPSREQIPSELEAADVIFQNGPIPENGVNGLTQEVLLEIVEHRLACFQDGPFACLENKKALQSLQRAKRWLHRRTQQRMNRGVEGTHTV